jgi:hypothetical protein
MIGSSSMADAEENKMDSELADNGRGITSA